MSPLLSVKKWEKGSGMIPAISDFFPTTFTDSLKNFVQPDKMVVATIFLFLNLLDLELILNNVSQSNVLLTFSKLDPALQIVLILIIILVFSYLLLSLNNAIYKLMTGEGWMFTWFGGLWILLQRKRRDRLMRYARASNLSSKVTGLEIVTGFPKDDRLLDPTRLGNVMNATASYIWHHYGMDMVALWPHMQNVIGTADPTLSTNINNEKSALDFLVNLTFILFLFAIELVVQSFVFQTHLEVLWALLSLGLAFLIYEVAVSKARTWGDTVQVAFDLHRDDLRQKLNVRPFTDEEDEQQVWAKISRLFLWGVPADDVFALPTSTASSSSTGTPTSANGPTAKTLSNVQPDIQSAITDAKQLISSSDEGCKLNDTISASNCCKYYQYIDYILTVSNNNSPDSSGNGAVKDIYVYVSDPRLPTIDCVPVAKIWKGEDWNNNQQQSTPKESTDKPTVMARPVLSATGSPNSGQQLLWYIDTLPPNTSIALFYRLPSTLLCKATITSADENQNLVLDLQGEYVDDMGTIDYTITVENKANTPVDRVMLEIFDSRKALPDYPKFGCVWKNKDGSSNQDDPQIRQAIPLPKSKSYQWELGTIGANQTFTLRYTL
ncbi:MAG TPA: hypothetical protein VJ761_14920 [Ktedonobacteraceae bacterium]|nr:hypothetical protein [Ktedonobacteraceae bacterium]